MIFNYISNACDEIESFFENKFDSKKIDVDDINIYRTHAFRVQAFGRLIKKAYKKSDLSHQKIRNIGETIKMSGKFIEDSIGNYLYHFEMKDYSKDSSKLEIAVKDLCKDIENFSSHIKKIRKSFTDLNPKEITNLYLKGFAREIKSIREDLMLIDPNLLEDGTHELRRKLRWLIMYVIYPEGLFKYKEKNPDVSKYTRLVSNESYDPVPISFEIINFLSKSVYDLGKIKDEGLSKNYNRPHSEINTSEPKIIKATQEVLEGVSAKKLLKKLRREIKDFLDQI